MASLPYEPTRGSGKNTTARFLKADLGDGYTQRSGDGIQTTKDNWSVTFEALDTTDANTLIAFFEERDGYQNFTWIPFRETVAKKFICPQWNESYLGNSLTTVNATFEQVYDRS